MWLTDQMRLMDGHAYSADLARPFDLDFSNIVVVRRQQPVQQQPNERGVREPLPPLTSALVTQYLDALNLAHVPRPTVVVLDTFERWDADGSHLSMTCTPRDIEDRAQRRGLVRVRCTEGRQQIRQGQSRIANIETLIGLLDDSADREDEKADTDTEQASRARMAVQQGQVAHLEQSVQRLEAQLQQEGDRLRSLSPPPRSGSRLSAAASPRPGPAQPHVLPFADSDVDTVPVVRQRASRTIV